MVKCKVFTLMDAVDKKTPNLSSSMPHGQHES